jgi:hypothetical protein
VFRTVAASIFLIAAPLAAQHQPLQPQPAAMQIFEKDWVLMNWALKYYDADHDVLLQPDEARAAAEGFRRLADSNGDGRVTPEEYRAARELILERY